MILKAEARGSEVVESPTAVLLEYSLRLYYVS